MGNCVYEGNSRHETIRAIHADFIDHDADPTRSIMQNNTDITSMVDLYRETLREAGLPCQAPAPTEKVEAIKCPVNIRKESLTYNNETSCIECLIDNDLSAVVEVRLKKNKELIARTGQEVLETGIQQRLRIDLMSDRAGHFQFMTDGDEVELEVIPLAPTPDQMEESKSPVDPSVSAHKVTF